MQTPDRVPPHRARGTLAATLVAVALSACGSSAPTQPPGTTGTATTQSTMTPTTKTPSTTGTGGTDMKDQIATTLEDRSPHIANAVRAEHTTVTPVDATALGDWQVVDVLSRGAAHPQRWFMGVKGEGSDVVVLSGFPERWSRVVEGAQVTSADQAVELATVHADATRDMTKGYTRIESVDDIRFLPKPSPEQKDRIAAITRDHDVTPAKATGQGPWEVRLWTVTDGDLVRHDVRVATDGSITDTPEAVERDLPVPVAR